MADKANVKPWNHVYTFPRKVCEGAPMESLQRGKIEETLMLKWSTDGHLSDSRAMRL